MASAGHDLAVMQALAINVVVVVKILPQCSPLRATPANRRVWVEDHERISACICASGLRRRRAPTVLLRLTFCTSICELVFEKFIGSACIHHQHDRIRGQSPIWKPTLPPSMRTAAGADRPPCFCGFRQEEEPLPVLHHHKAGGLQIGNDHNAVRVIE